MTSVYYRSATVADAEELWRVRTSAIVARCSEHYCRETVRAWASAPMHPGFISLIKTSFFVVAQVEHQIVGYGFLNAVQAKVEGVFVHPQHTRRGIAKTLLNELEMRARTAKLVQLTLDSTLNAAPFYTAQGYRRLASGMWTHPTGVDIECVHMAKDL